MRRALPRGSRALGGGKLTKLSKTGRATLLLSMLGGEVPVEVDGSQVRAA